MPFANLPLRFTAKVQTDGPRLYFAKSEILVRYVPYDPEEPRAEELVIAAVARADNDSELPVNCWSVTDVDGSGYVRVFKVAFHGDILNGLIGLNPAPLFAQQPGAAAQLHNAFVEQALINLQVLMSRHDAALPYYTGLQLRLGYIEI
jgi:hypothetical protein